MEPKRIRAIIGLSVFFIISLIFLMFSFINKQVNMIETETYKETELIQEESSEKEEENNITEKDKQEETESVLIEEVFSKETFSDIEIYTK